VFTVFKKGVNFWECRVQIEDWCLENADWALRLGDLQPAPAEATGLLSVGHGRYYDPATVRFINRGGSECTNPYVPWNANPSAGFLALLALLWLIYSRKRTPTGTDTFTVLLVVVAAAGMGLAGCGRDGLPSTQETEPRLVPSPQGQRIVEVWQDGQFVNS
jgi:hypothetical protein